METPIPCRILLVEDEPLDARQLELVLHRALSRCSFALTHVETIADACDWLAHDRADLIVLDLSLPDAGGEDAFAAISAAAGGSAIVILTGSADDALAIRLLRLGAQDVLQKSEQSPREIVRCFENAIERAKVDCELARATREAEAAARAKSAFLANMSHEIRTPLNAILGMADLLRRTNLAEDQSLYVEIFHRAGNGLRDLLDNLLALSHAESGELELRDEAFEFEEVAAAVVETFAVQAHRKGLGIVCDVDASLAVPVRGDRTRVRQILANLVGNAVKFTERGHIVVEARHTGERVLVSVTDTGPGIPEREREKIFARFGQAEAGLAAPSGTGLGLAICREIAERMGGSVTVADALPQGTRFDVDLPLPRCGEAERRERVGLDGARVLVLEDDPVERACYARWIREAGGVAIECATTGEARRALAEQPPVVAALLDSRMPTEGGLALAASLHGGPRWPLRPVIALMLNHRSDDLPAVAAMSAHALHKPLRREPLIAALAGRSLAAAAPPAEEVALRGRILVAEDSPDNLLLIRSFLAETGLELRCVRSGREAVALACGGEPFDLVLMDLSMPEMDGLAATRAIRCTEQATGAPRTPIVALSAHAFAGVVEEAEAAGCDGYVVKPFDRATLVEAVRLHARGAASAAEEPEGSIDDLIPAYIERRRADLADLEAALCARDLERIQLLGHRMKGSGAGYGLPRVSEIGARLEDAARAGEIETAAAAVDQLRYFLVREAQRRDAAGPSTRAA